MKRRYNNPITEPRFCGLGGQSLEFYNIVNDNLLCPAQLRKLSITFDHYQSVRRLAGHRHFVADMAWYAADAKSFGGRLPSTVIIAEAS